MLHQLSDMGHEAVITAAQRRKLKQALKRQQVRREHLFRIVSAWIITVPPRRSSPRCSTSPCAG